jgi:diketogulonate reductase-like aldo/keto reductase
MTTTSTNQRVSRLYDDHPAFIYGTAWKKDQTKRLVKEALAAGFRRVDTAAQPRHYQEALVGEALCEAFTEGVLKREELYVRVHTISNILNYTYMA